MIKPMSKGWCARDGKYVAQGLVLPPFPLVPMQLLLFPANAGLRLKH
jgi:hypothetical protein